jgi:hypothetical protein
MSHIAIKSNLIGIPDIQIPLDDDLLLVFNASKGQLMLPVLFAQVLRNLKDVTEKIEGSSKGRNTQAGDDQCSPGCSGGKKTKN